MSDEKYRALEQTWLAANQQFIAFQEMARQDLDLAKSLMSPAQLKQWQELRERHEVADYGQQGEHAIVDRDEHEQLKRKVEQLKQQVKQLEELPYEDVKVENERLKTDMESLEAQLEQATVDYENATNAKAIMETKYADIEETLLDKAKEYEQTSRLDNLERELGALETDFRRIKGDVSRRLQTAKTVRQAKQAEIDEIMNENRFLVGRHRTNQHEIHELIQQRLQASDVQNVVEELQKMLVEEKTAGELKARKLVDERVRLEESIHALRVEAERSRRDRGDELHVARERQAEMENMRIRLDQGNQFY